MKYKLELNYDFYKILSLGALNTLILLFLAYFNSKNNFIIFPFFVFVLIFFFTSIYFYKTYLDYKRFLNNQKNNKNEINLEIINKEINEIKTKLKYYYENNEKEKILFFEGYLQSLKNIKLLIKK